MVGAGNDLKDNLRVAVVKDLEAALSLAEAMRGRDYLQQAGCRFEETEAADIIQQANVFPETLSWADIPFMCQWKPPLYCDFSYFH